MIDENELRRKLTPEQRATLDEVAMRVHVVMRSPARRKQKYFRLVQIADRANAAVMPHTPCGKGCAHCCHIPVVISHREAKRIEAYSGRVRDRLLDHQVIDSSAGVEQMKAREAKFVGVRCPFLGSANECTVYDVRPMACRTYHSLNKTADPCDTKKHKGGIVPRFNFMSLSMGAACVDLSEPFADIREFFP